jgi:hypothetical protein
MKLRAPEDAPQWLHRFARRIVEADQETKDVPLILHTFTTTTMPTAAKWPAGLVYVSDITMVAVSTGSIWKRLDTGAPI